MMNVRNCIMKLSSVCGRKAIPFSSGRTRNFVFSKSLRIQNEVQTASVVQPTPVKSVELREIPPSKGIISSLVLWQKWTWFQRHKVSIGAYSLYIKCVDDIDFTFFVKRLALEDTFWSWFLLTQLHVWMCMVRLIQEKYYGEYAIYRMSEAMWEDIEDRLKLMLVVKRREKQAVMYYLHHHMQRILFIYDEGLGSDKSLAWALWSVFFNTECKHPEHLELLVQYVRMQLQHLDGISTEDILHGNLSWLPFKELELT